MRRRLNCYSDDLLDEVYLARKRIKENDFILTNSTDTFYFVDSDVVISIPNDPDNSSFKLIKYPSERHPEVPLLEVCVDPNTTRISFNSCTNNGTITRFQAEFDHLEKNWDVRSFVDGNSKVSTLYYSLRDLESLEQFGMDEKLGFLSIIEGAKKLNPNNKGMELNKQ